MWCLTQAECEALVTGRGLQLEASEQRVVHRGAEGVCFHFFKEPWSRLAYVSDILASAIEPFEECLCWVTLWGVWSSTDDHHLYYRFRESHGERRHLTAAPGHLFAGYEKADLKSLIQLALLAGWDFHLLPYPEYASVYVSHDDYAHVYLQSESARVDLEKELVDGKLEHHRIGPAAPPESKPSA